VLNDVIAQLDKSDVRGLNANIPVVTCNIEEQKSEVSMLPRVTALIAALTLLCSSATPVQTKEHSPDSLLARLSYHSTYGVDWREQQDSPRICFALYRSGYYRILRVTEDGTKSLHGTLPRDELLRVGGMLKNLNGETNADVHVFDSSDRWAPWYGDGIIRKGSESLRAEMVRGGEAIHFVWIDPDHERPFPDSAMRIVNWLQRFRALGASPLTLRELSDEPICPPASGKHVEPVL
jgi:hypothetical protein